MEPSTIAIIAGTTANAVIVLGGFALWLSYRTRRIERSLSQERPHDLLARIDARLDELTRAVDVVAVEVERVAEAQRYLALHGQTGATLPPVDPPGRPGPRSVTPH